MSDLIKRSDAIKATWQEPTYTDPLNVLTEVRDRIEAIPSADLNAEFAEWAKLWFKKELEADKPQGEWIDCKEPPSTDRNVFIAYGTDDMKSVCIGHYRHDMKLWYEDENFFAKPIYDAMYWCEIPQFPTWMEGADDE